MLRHADGREAVDAHAEAHFDIGAGGPADRVHQFVLARDFPALGGEHEEAVLVPGDFVRLHPEGIEAHFVLRLFVLFARGSVAGEPMANSPAGIGTIS